MKKWFVKFLHLFTGHTCGKCGCYLKDHIRAESFVEYPQGTVYCDNCLCVYRPEEPLVLKCRCRR